MIKIDKSYTIAFSYAGVTQYAEIKECNGELVRPKVFVSWMNINSEEYKIVESIEQMTNVTDILNALKSIAFCNRAEIILINHAPIEYSKKPYTQKYVESVEKRIEELLEVEAKLYFQKILEPYMKKNKWFISRSHIGYPIVIEKDKKGEWQNLTNVKKETYFEFLCYKFVKNINKGECDLKNNRVKAFVHFFNLINTDYFIQRKLYIEL